MYFVDLKKVYSFFIFLDRKLLQLTKMTLGKSWDVVVIARRLD
jgi:hypothetical protein